MQCGTFVFPFPILVFKKQKNDFLNPWIITFSSDFLLCKWVRFDKKDKYYKFTFFIESVPWKMESSFQVHAQQSDKINRLNNSIDRGVEVVDRGSQFQRGFAVVSNWGYINE